MKSSTRAPIKRPIRKSIVLVAALVGCLIAFAAKVANGQVQIEPLPPLDQIFEPAAYQQMPAPVPQPKATPAKATPDQPEQVWPDPMPTPSMPETGPYVPGPPLRREISGPDPSEPWDWRVLPDGLIYHSYLAGVKEPRLASVWNYTQGQGWMWDIVLGGRAGLLRYGTQSDFRPQGWQLDVEGAAFPRLNLEHDADLDLTDFRAGFPLTYGCGRYAMKFAGYHLSSHFGDEFLERNNTLDRINYSRDVLVWGHAYWLTDNIRVYGEAGWAFHNDGGSEPWEFQFGAEYSPIMPSGLRGTPFWAVNGQLREEVNYGGNVVAQAGWQWRGAPAGHRFRAGFEYYNGKSRQLEIYNRSEQQLGMGIWFDF